MCNMKVVPHNRRLFSYTTKQLKSRLNCWGVGGDQNRKRTESGTLRVSAGQNHRYKPSLRFLMCASAQSCCVVFFGFFCIFQPGCKYTWTRNNRFAGQLWIYGTFFSLVFEHPSQSAIITSLHVCMISWFMLRVWMQCFRDLFPHLTDASG